MAELRRAYRDRLGGLVDQALEMGALAVDMIPEVMTALQNHDAEHARRVIRSDDLVDAHHRELQEGVLTLLALEAPVASELRLISSLIHVNIHIERMGDYCVNVAKFVASATEWHPDAELSAQLQEMGVHTRTLATRALEAYARRDVDLARQLPALDDPVDRLNKGLFRRLVTLAAEQAATLDWAMSMVLVARYLERLGDHAVDIGEQVIFVVTGETESLA